jgi:hypothetical protein
VEKKGIILTGHGRSVESLTGLLVVLAYAEGKLLGQRLELVMP